MQIEYIVITHSTTLCEHELSHGCQSVITINVFPLHPQLQRGCNDNQHNSSLMDGWMDRKQHQHDITIIIVN